MDNRVQFWLLVFFFIVLPLLQWILRKFTEQSNSEQRERTVRRAESSGGGQATQQRQARGGLQDVLREIVEEQKKAYESEPEWRDDEPEWRDADDEEFASADEGWETVPPEPVAAPPVAPAVSSIESQGAAGRRTGALAHLVNPEIVTTSADEWAPDEDRPAFVSRRELRSPRDLRRILAWREVLAPPLALRSDPEGGSPA
ncbi:MAG: hypothetical protein AAF581_23785 [Planctomycetota bacterium]